LVLFDFGIIGIIFVRILLEESPMQTIKAAVLRKKGGPYEIESLKLDGPRDNEVLVRNVASGICHTDIAVGESRDVAAKPLVLGHEGAGVVVEVGKNVKSVRPGDHVILSFQYCGACQECREGHPWACQHFFPLNFGFSRLDGSNALHSSGVYGHFFGQSSFSTHSLVAETNVTKVSPELNLEILAPLGCGFMTGSGTVMNLLKVPKGASFAVFGTGAVGIAALMAARIVGAAPIIGVDIHTDRLKLARELGATHVINSRQDDVASVISSITGGGIDFILDTTGNSTINQIAVGVLNPRGTIANVAGPLDQSKLPGEKKSVRVTMGNSFPQKFIPELIRFHQSGTFPIDRLEKFYDFSQINQAIADSKSGVTIKPVLRISPMPD
jgi:aryl-alcohol dehydrogenase